MVERWIFYRRHKVAFESLREEFSKCLDKGDFEAAAKLLAKTDSLETNVVLAGLRGYAKGPESVEDLLTGAMAREKTFYERRLSIRPPWLPIRPTSACSARCSASCAHSRICRRTWPPPAQA